MTPRSGLRTLTSTASPACATSPGNPDDLAPPVATIEPASLVDVVRRGRPPREVRRRRRRRAELHRAQKSTEVVRTFAGGAALSSCRGARTTSRRELRDRGHSGLKLGQRVV